MDVKNLTNAQMREIKKAIENESNKRHKLEKKFEKTRVKKVKTNYRVKQKVAKNLRKEGNIDKKASVKVTSEKLNKLIITGTDEIESDTDSDLEEEAEDAGYVPIRETYNEVKRQLKRKKGLKKKFRVKFKSYLNKNIATEFPKEFPFRSLSHYKNFLLSLDKMNPEPLDSTATLRIMAKEYDVLKYVKVEVSVIKGGCNTHTDTSKIINTSTYKLKLYNPIDKYNNCGLKCIEHIFDIEISYKKVREEFELNKDLIDGYSMNKIYEKYNKSNKKLSIIEESFNDKFDFTKFDYLLIRKSHYYVVEKAEVIDQKDKSTKRGLLVWDIETRESEDTIDINHYDYIDDNGKLVKEKSVIKSKILKDIITAIYYRDYKSETTNKKIFETDDKSSSIRKFINFLKDQASNNKHYNCIAHNSARFDHYFLLSEMSEVEQYQTEYQFRGYSIIGLQFCSHLFKDSYCFMTNSLKTLCDSFKIDEKLRKKDKFMYDGKEMTNEQLCFYKPNLKIKQFLKLKENEPKFWSLYKEYCLYDCISLFHIWTSFQEATKKLIGTIDGRLLQNCGINSCNTIGSLAMKITRKINAFPENKKLFKKFIEFTETKEKFDFVNGITRLDSQKTGGISHCCMPGKHTEEISSVDIASQYPASLMYMKIPTGESEFITKYDKNKYGFYQLEDLKFDCEYRFKPVCSKEEGKSLDWDTGKSIKKACLDSWMIKYLEDFYGLKSYKVIKGLVSDDYITGKQLFGKFIETLYNEKASQDKLKTEKSNDYNPSLREVIKLMMNALTGKLNEEVHKYYKIEVTDKKTEYKIGAINIDKTPVDKYNQYITAGVMTYSYSKRLLFEYIKCLPNDSDDVIHVETDSIYFKSKNKDEFFKNIQEYDGKYPVALGPKLGNVKIEKDKIKDTYFLGKKFYYISDDTMKIKGIPGKTITNDGTEVKLINKQLYIDIYKGKEVTKTFKTMKKQLFSDQIFISSYEMTRTIKPNCDYYEYETDSDSDSSSDED